MIGKVAAVGVAGAVAYNKLKGMDSEGIRNVGNKVTGMVQSAAEKADKSEFLKNIKSTLESSKVGSVVVSAASKAVGAVQSGASRFFEVMAQAKDQADKGEGTFGKNIVKAGVDSAKGGLQSMVASGVTAVADKLGFVSKEEAMRNTVTALEITQATNEKFIREHFGSQQYDEGEMSDDDYLPG